MVGLFFRFSKRTVTSTQEQIESTKETSDESSDLSYKRSGLLIWSSLTESTEEGSSEGEPMESKV